MVKRAVGNRNTTTYTTYTTRAMNGKTEHTMIHVRFFRFCMIDSSCMVFGRSCGDDLEIPEAVFFQIPVRIAVFVDGKANIGIFKRLGSDVYHAFRNRQFFEIFTFVKRAVSDAFQPFRETNRLQPFRFIEQFCPQHPYVFADRKARALFRRAFYAE